MTEFEEYIRYFNNVKVDVEDVTTDEEKQDHQKAVIATYNFDGQIFKTDKLYYKRIIHARNIKNSEYVEKYFKDEIYWLDIDIHDWPQSSGETDIDELIIGGMTSDPIFQEYLKQLANNESDGYIQLISKQGRSNQYYRNFENNNHWHDIVLLIKAVIDGITDLDPFLKPLVFRWDGNKHTERLRSSLSPHFGSRSLLRHLIQNVNLKKSIVLKELIMQEQLELLKYKKQIILQGPPGTGKTKLAKELAKNIVQNENGEYDADQLQLIQFHPSYTYEDFVRGISVNASADGKGVVYKTENKIFGTIIEDANKNLIDSQKDSETLSYENWVLTVFDTFIEYLSNLLPEPTSSIRITDNVDIVSIEDDAFRYKGRKGWSKLGNRMLFDDVIKAIVANNISRQDIKKNTELSGLAKWHASYYIRVVDLFREFIEEQKLEYKATTEVLVSRKEFVLIIDEINRANLSSVLGELIYALEYRNEGVKSMYSMSDKDELIIPDNLYIIGTMNTADRSVSQIDYAIRRRFAFLDVLPEDLTNDPNVQFDGVLFNQVRMLFRKDDDTYSAYLSEEFNPDQVQLGHSYFIQQYEKDKDGNNIIEKPHDFNMRLEYEIKPILKEYVKDGILKKNALAEIEKLSCSR